MSAMRRTTVVVLILSAVCADVRPYIGHETSGEEGVVELDIEGTLTCNGQPQERIEVVIFNNTVPYPENTGFRAYTDPSGHFEARGRVLKNQPWKVNIYHHCNYHNQLPQCHIRRTYSLGHCHKKYNIKVDLAEPYEDEKKNCD